MSNGWQGSPNDKGLTLFHRISALLVIAILIVVLIIWVQHRTPDNACKTTGTEECLPSQTPSPTRGTK